MSDTPETGPAPTPTDNRFRISEDWAATVVGLVLLVLILTGVISKGILQ
ncbi:hypothetical protein [Micromonospora sp. 067-2]